MLPALAVKPPRNCAMVLPNNFIGAAFIISDVGLNVIVVGDEIV